jgi:hypothetical protein
MLIPISLLITRTRFFEQYFLISSPFFSTGPVTGMARVWDYLSGSALLRNFNLRVHKFTFQVFYSVSSYIHFFYLHCIVVILLFVLCSTFDFLILLFDLIFYIISNFFISLFSFNFLFLTFFFFYFSVFLFSVGLGVALFNLHRILGTFFFQRE